MFPRNEFPLHTGNYYVLKSFSVAASHTLADGGNELGAQGRNWANWEHFLLSEVLPQDRKRFEVLAYCQPLDVQFEYRIRLFDFALP